MTKSKLLLLRLTLAPLAIVSISAQYTYWIDQSCRRPNHHFELAFIDTQSWASLGLDWLTGTPDVLQQEAFRRLFGSGEVSFDMRIKRIVMRALDHIRKIVPEPNNDRSQANYRYYCDNDAADPNPDSTTRWKIKEDPPPARRPRDYIPQRQRPPRHDAPPDHPYQEWVDADNGMVMADMGCQKAPALQAVTFRTKRPGRSTRNQQLRATVTLCEWQLTEGFPTFESLPFVDVRDESIRFLDEFRTASAFVLLHESLHLPPKSLDDLPSPTDQGQLAYGWRNAIALSPPLKVRNPDNYAYFCLLARLAKHNWQLSALTWQAEYGAVGYPPHKAGLKMPGPESSENQGQREQSADR
ncbi:MAG: hypothetical protein Q9227_008809 [Pyrenula ochraceoflavens]